MRIPVSVILLDLYSSCGILGEEAFDILSDLRRTEEKNHYGTILKTNFQQGSPINYSQNRSYIRKYQDRQNHNRPTKICERGLEKRIANQKLKMQKVQKEEKIKEAFARKIKNKTYHKRHHSKNSNTY